jgi:hypothetical protein
MTGPKAIKGREMKTAVSKLFLGSLLFFVSAGCTPKPDPNKDFQMFLDGSVFLWESAPGVGYLYGGEGSFVPKPASVMVILPNLGRNQRPLPGLEIMFDLDSFAKSNQVTFSGGSDGLNVDFRPSYRPMGRNGLLVGYSSQNLKSIVTLRLDEVNHRNGGKLKGKIIYAMLWGYFYNCETGKLTDPPKPFKLEIWNWPFEVLLQQKYYGDQ